MPRQNQINLKISHKSQREDGTALAEHQEVTLAVSKANNGGMPETESTEMFPSSASGKQLVLFGHCQGRSMPIRFHNLLTINTGAEGKPLGENQALFSRCVALNMLLDSSELRYLHVLEVNNASCSLWVCEAWWYLAQAPNDWCCSDLFPHCPHSTWQFSSPIHSSGLQTMKPFQFYLDFFKVRIPVVYGSFLCPNDIFPSSFFISSRHPLIPWHNVQQHVQIYSSPGRQVPLLLGAYKPRNPR